MRGLLPAVRVAHQLEDAPSAGKAYQQPVQPEPPKAPDQRLLGRDDDAQRQKREDYAGGHDVEDIEPYQPVGREVCRAL